MVILDFLGLLVKIRIVDLIKLFIIFGWSKFVYDGGSVVIGYVVVMR